MVGHVFGGKLDVEEKDSVSYEINSIHVKDLRRKRNYPLVGRKIRSSFIDDLAEPNSSSSNSSNSRNNRAESGLRRRRDELELLIENRDSILESLVILCICFFVVKFWIGNYRYNNNILD